MLGEFVIVQGQGVLHKRHNFVVPCGGGTLLQAFQKLDANARTFQTLHSAKNKLNQLVMHDPERWRSATVVDSFVLKLEWRAAAWTAAKV